MFVLAEMKKVVKITPDLFHLKLSDAIASEINNKLANKVVLNVGLCIALFDILEIQESYIFPGDGSSHTRVSFRYIVFRPFMDEILVGKIRSADAEGLHVSLGFFDDIIVPRHALQHPSKFNEREQVWVWEYNVGEGEDKHELFMDSNETIRFKVTAEGFHETNVPSSTIPNISGTENKVPYLITGSINEPGLGLLSWWDN